MGCCASSQTPNARSGGYQTTAPLAASPSSSVAPNSSAPTVAATAAAATPPPVLPTHCGGPGVWQTATAPKALLAQPVQTVDVKVLAAARAQQHAQETAAADASAARLSSHPAFASLLRCGAMCMGEDAGAGGGLQSHMQMHGEWMNDIAARAGSSLAAVRAGWTRVSLSAATTAAFTAAKLSGSLWEDGGRQLLCVQGAAKQLACDKLCPNIIDSKGKPSRFDAGG